MNIRKFLHRFQGRQFWDFEGFFMVHMGIAKDLPARHCVASESDMTPVYLEKSAFSGVAGGPASAGKVKRAFNRRACLKLSPAERPGHLDIRPIKSESFASIGKDYAR